MPDKEDDWLELEKKVLLAIESNAVNLRHLILELKKKIEEK